MADFSPFAMPMGYNPATDVVIGSDDAGRDIYQTPFGQTYTLAQQPAPTREGAPGSAERIKSVLLNMLRGAAGGVTAPGRALRGEDVTVGDAFATAGMAQLGGAAMPAPRGAIRSAALRTEAATPAQRIGDMLRVGRAADVTDELMAQADPQEMWRLYESGATGADMPMDAASRMARAEGMGFDTGTPLYHGTGNDFQAFDRAHIGAREDGWFGDGVYSTAMQELAGEYAIPSSSYATPNPNIIPMVIRPGRTVDWPGTRVAPGKTALSDSVDTVRVTHDWSSLTPLERANYEVVSANPVNIRSRFARFDPRLSHLANLNAANASPAVGAATLSSMDARQRGLEWLLSKIMGPQ